MFSAAPSATPVIRVHQLADTPPVARPSARISDRASDQAASERVSGMLRMLADALAPERRVVRAGDAVCRAGERFGKLHVLNSGLVKIVGLSPEGHEQVVGLKFRGDWMGLDGIAPGEYACDAVALDTGEVWTFRYDAFLAACARQPALLNVLHEAMSREIGQDRASLMAICSLPADARVADFLRYWAQSLARRGQRTDQITLRMTRAEIGNYLGMTLESVSRAISRLARANVIAFAGKGRRDVTIPDVDALQGFVQECLASAASTSAAAPAVLQ